MRRLLLGASVAAVVLALLPASALADTVDPAPVRAITTSFPAYGVARHPVSGNLYVAGEDGVIHLFSGAATGAATEITSFPAQGFCTNQSHQLAIDPTGTQLLMGCQATNAIARYAIDSNGLLTPQPAITGSVGPYQAGFAPGGLIVVASRGNNAVNIYNPAVSVSVVQAFIQGGNTQLAQPAAALMAPDGSIYVANAESIVVFGPGQTGNPFPTRTITLPDGVHELESLAMDSAGDLYVGAFTGGILVYPPGANGAATPLRRLTGPTSGQEGELTQLQLDASRNLYVSEIEQFGSGGRVSTFAPLVPLAGPAAVAPGAVTKLKVAGKKTAGKRTVTWLAGPAGTSPVTSYVVVVTKGKKQLSTKTTTKTKLVLKRKKLKKSGKLTVTVTAVSAVGSGPPVSTTFKVTKPR